MRVLSLNTWKCDGDYTHRLALMAQGLHSQEPDVVLLQEVFASEEGLYDTAQHLAQALSLTCLRAPSRRKPREVQGRVVASSCGLALLTRLPVLQTQVLELPNTPEDGERIAHITQLSSQGQLFWVANVHLTHLPAAAELRQEQISTVATALNQRGPNQPAIMGGDFNASIDSPEIAPFLSGPHAWSNAFAGQHKRTHRTPDGQWLDIDHFLLRGGNTWVVNAAQTILPTGHDTPEANASDHAALLMDLGFAKAP